MAPQETDPDLSVSVQESLAEVWVDSSLLQGLGHYVRQCMHETFEGGGNYLHYPLHSLVSGQKTGRENRPTYQQNIGLKFC